MTSLFIDRLLIGLAASMLLATPVSAATYPPERGTDRESTAYLDAAERALLALDLDDPALTFDRLSGTTATNWAVIRNGQRIANLKCTGGNTDHHGGVVAYRLGRELGFPIYPVAVYRDVRRRVGDRNVDEQCELKEWASVFTQYYWSRDTFRETSSEDKRRLTAALACDGPMPGPAEPFTYTANSAYGHPSLPQRRRTPYRGETTLLAAARDFSSMMVVDALIGNEDRFPGGNTFFRSVSTRYEQRDGSSIVFDDVRLFSLDNEAAFKGRSPRTTHAARDLAAHVSRFDGELMAALEALARDDARLVRLTDGDEALRAFLESGFSLVQERFADARKRCGAAAVFTDR